MNFKFTKAFIMVTKLSIKVLALLFVTLEFTFAEKGNAQVKSVKEVKISLQMQNAKLAEVFNKIEERTDYSFNFSEDKIVLSRRINLNFNDATVEDVLLKISEKMDLEFKQVNNSIGVSLRKKSRPQKTILVSIMNFTVTGTVTEENGQPLPGATVVEKGTTNGSVTDASGKYTLQVTDENAVLMFSFVGYLPEEIPVNGRSLIDLTLFPDITSLQEIVVVGYGTQNKKDVSGAISSVRTDELGEMPLIGVDQLLTGQAAGVQISQSNAAPGGALRVNIRGSVSVTSGQQPLYVLDGYPISVGNNQMSNPLNNINPNDIESIEILKDASASAIYGSRASNGVVIITTKKGKAGKTQFDLDFYTGIQQVERKVDVLNAREFATLYAESRNNGYIDFFGGQGAQITDDNDTRSALGAGNNTLYLIDPSLADPSQFGEGTDWQDEIFRNAPITNIQLSARGGTDKTRYYLSGGYFDQQGVVIESGFQRYSFNANLESDVAEKVTLGFNINTAYTDSEIVNAEGSWHEGGVVTSALMMPPTMSVFDDEGNYQDLRDVYPNWGFVDVANPVQAARETDRTAVRFRTTGSFFTEYEILEGLKFKGLFGADYSTFREDKFSASTLNQRAWGDNRAYRINTTFLNYLSEFTLNYNKTFGEGHNLDLLGGYTIQKETVENTLVESGDFPNDLVTDVTGGIVTNYESNPAEWSLLSLLGRINYDYMGKYLVTLSFRRDGSSRFGDNVRWGNFPSASIAWRMSDEPFLKDFSLLDELKLRASYGLTGNNAIGNYSAIGLLSPSNYVVDGNVRLGQRKGTLQNEELGWENTRQLNVGLDIGLFEGRLLLTTDIYDKYTDNLLLNVPVTSITGVTEYTTNIGEVSNRGWEITVNSRNLVGDFQWSTSFNISGNRNRVEKLGLTDEPIFTGAIAGQSHVAMVGEPIGSFVGYRWDGLYLSQEELDNAPDIITIGGRQSFVGDVRWKDVDGDGDVDLDDQTVLGSWEPDFIYGLTNNFSYRNFDLSVFIQGSQGNEVYNIQKRNLGVMTLYGNGYRESLGRFQSIDNPGNGVLPKVKRALANNATTRSSNYYIDDASYLRIRNITLGYTLPSSALEKLRINSLRTYLSVQNVYTFTDYVNYNPEVSATNTTSAFDTGINPLTPGIDYGSYPTARTFILGLNLTF